mmetsp:Transcript_40780/g.105812  ORF Transcript_40780/g.105812 Transcript_40780/m.105812 type:complete len:271 (-) Transcript_40780:174-986(-)
MHTLSTPASTRVGSDRDGHVGDGVARLQRDIGHQHALWVVQKLEEDAAELEYITPDRRHGGGGSGLVMPTVAASITSSSIVDRSRAATSKFVKDKDERPEVVLEVFPPPLCHLDTSKHLFWREYWKADAAPILQQYVLLQISHAWMLNQVEVKCAKFRVPLLHDPLIIAEVHLDVVHKVGLPFTLFFNYARDGCPNRSGEKVLIFAVTCCHHPIFNATSTSTSISALSPAALPCRTSPPTCSVQPRGGVGRTVIPVAIGVHVTDVHAGRQ